MISAFDDTARLAACDHDLQELGAKYDEVDIPEDMAELAAEYREKLIEQVAELDDDVMMAYLDVSGGEGARGRGRARARAVCACG